VDLEFKAGDHLCLRVEVDVHSVRLWMPISDVESRVALHLDAGKQREQCRDQRASHRLLRGYRPAGAVVSWLLC